VPNLFSDHIPLLRPWLGKAEIEAVERVIRSGWISQGQVVEEFEKKVANYVGAKYAVATNSCTSALHLSLRLMGVSSTDEVICPSFTCMATANAIHHTGAVPVFADIDEKTYNLDPKKIEGKITTNTKAILVVHQIGLPADIDGFKLIVNKYRLALIQDAATALGAIYKKTRLGGDGGPTCFSFHPRKIITTGEGGMIVTDDKRLAIEAKSLGSTGASISDLVRHKAKGKIIQQYFSFGYNYRMTDIQAAIGVVQMRKIDKILSERKIQAKIYDEAFTKNEKIVIPYVPKYATHCFSSYMIRIKNSKVSRDTLIRKMADLGISCRIGIQPLHFEPFYKNQKKYKNVSLQVTEMVANDSIFLPIFPSLTRSQQNHVITSLLKII